MVPTPPSFAAIVEPRRHGSVSDERTVTATPGASILGGTNDGKLRTQAPTFGASRVSLTLSAVMAPSGL